MYNPQLDTFVKVAEAGSFSKAAQALYITPTAVIKQMNLLESHVGVVLFHRSHAGLSLTDAGKSLLEDSRRMIALSQDAIARAHRADRSEKRIVRVGVSLMTPSTRLTELWPQVKERCPGMSMQVVSFENTPEAPKSLANLGADIDVILGVYDERSLVEWKCEALHLANEPLRVAVSLDSPLAELESVTFDDLEGTRLMMIRRGWNDAMDGLRERIRAQHPQLEIEDFDQYRADTFNRCATAGAAMVSLDLWKDAQPMLRTLPLDVDVTLSYGILHSPQPSEHVAEFLAAMQEAVEQ